MCDVIEILTDLVELASVNPPGDEDLVCRCLESFCRAHGIEFSLQVVSPGRHNLLARLPGVCSRPLVFTGHMDVVPVSESEALRWAGDPFIPRIRHGRLYGRGACDMKAGLAAALAAMVQVREAGCPLPHDIVLCATVDEEFLMRGSAAIMADGLLADPVGIIVCEPTGLDLATASRGRTFGRITFHGHTGHGSDPSSSLNALDLAHEFMSRMKTVTFARDGTFWQALSIQAGVEPGVIPDECTLGIDARLGLDHEPAAIWLMVDEIMAAMASRHPAMTWQVRIDDERESWQTPGTDPFLHQVTASWLALGQCFSQTQFPGTTDGTKLRRSGAPCIITGPGDLALAHRENESVELAQVYRAVSLYAHLMTHCRIPSSPNPDCALQPS